MDIDAFIAKYRPDWERLEQATKAGSRGIVKLRGSEIQEVIRLYLRTSGHLGEVRTRYHDRPVEDYLTGVIARAHAAIYSTKSRSVGGFFRLMGRRYRESVRETAPFIAISAVVLGITIILTLFWVSNSPDARVGLIPPSAQEAIKKAGGNPVDFGVSSATVSTFILLNNARVALLAFGLGITLGLGTAYVLISNGFLIGVLGGGFQAAGKGWEFWSLVLPHGLLELFAICIASGAGLRMGWTIIDPGDRFRGRALAEESRRAVIVVIGVIPAFIVAALIEGFVSGSGVVPPWMQLALGVAVCVLYLLALFGLTRSKTPVSLDSQVLIRKPSG